MEPRKKDIMDYALPILGAVFALYVSLLLAMSYDAVNKVFVENLTAKQEAGEEITRKDEVFPYADMFSDFATRVETNPGDIQWGESSPKFFFVTLLILLLAYGYMATTQKKFINNKEYGTSEWGTPKQIAHLLARNLKKAEFKRIRKGKGGNKAKQKKEAELKYADSSNIIFTQTEKICMYNFELNNNTMIIGGSGSGKTRGYVLPNILQCCDSPYSPSIVVTDPKGEILSKIGKYLEDNKYVIKVLNLKEQDRSFCFNPFCYVMEEKYEEQISNLVSSIMDSRSEGKEQKSNDPFWEDMAKVLLKAIFYATYEGFPKQEQNMPVVMELFRWFEVSDKDDRYNNPTKLDRFFDVFGDKNGLYDTVENILDFYKKYYAECLEITKMKSTLNLQNKAMRENLAIPIYSSNSAEIDRYAQEIEGLVSILTQLNILTEDIEGLAFRALESIEIYKQARYENYENHKKPIGVRMFEKYGDVNSNPALRSWEDFRTKCKGKTAQSVTATALAKLAPFDEAQIRRIFSKDEMELDLVGERKTALFIILPPTNTNYNFMANVLYTMLFEQLEYCATVKHNQSLPVPVRFILDEFYNTGRIPKFENILSYARSFGIGISIILQSLDQIKEMYEKSWGTVLDNCSTFLYLGGIRHADTLEYISKLLGKGTFDKKTYSRTKGRQSSTSTSFDKIGRELLDPSEIQRLNKKKCLLFVQGYQPYLSRKFNYTTHKNYKYTSDSNKKNLYYYKTPQDLEAESNTSVPTEEKLPHGEEVKKNKNITTIQPLGERRDIEAGYDYETNAKKLQENCLAMEVVGVRASLISDDEVERELEELLNEEMQAKEHNDALIEKLIHKEPLVVADKEEEIRQNLEKLKEDEETIEMFAPTEMDEEEEESAIYLDDEDNSEYIEDLKGVEDLLHEVMSLTDDVIGEGFADDLSNFDISNLEQGEICDNEEETQEE